MPETVPSPEMVSTLLVVVTVLHAIALTLTSFRLWFRHHIRRLWWDDLWATLALFCDAVCTVVVWLVTAPLDRPYVNTEAWPTPAQSRSVHIVTFWLNFLCYTCSIWFARISIVISVIRIVPPSRDVRMSVLMAGVVFACMWTYMIACKSAVCAMDPSWYDALIIQCSMPSWVAVSEVCTDAVSDLILVALPLCLLWRVKLPTNQRIMILSVFSTSILVSIVSAVHTAYIIPQTSFIGGATAAIEGAVSLVVCNLLVIVTFVHRFVRNADLTAGLSGKPSPASTGYSLTTVDLDYTCFTTTGTGTGANQTQTVTGFTGTNVSSVVFVPQGNESVEPPRSRTGTGANQTRTLTGLTGANVSSVVFVPLDDESVEPMWGRSLGT